MSVFSLLYASKSNLAAEDADAGLEEIIASSRPRNRDGDITGCLIFASGRFAQVLEGEQAAVEILMARIARDPRHTEISILDRSFVVERRFVGWSLDYAGPSLFVQRMIASPISAALQGSQRGVSDLLRVMTGLRSDETSD